MITKTSMFLLLLALCLLYVQAAEIKINKSAKSNLAKLFSEKPIKAKLATDKVSAKLLGAEKTDIRFDSPNSPQSTDRTRCSSEGSQSSSKENLLEEKLKEAMQKAKAKFDRYKFSKIPKVTNQDFVRSTIAKQ